MAGIQITEAASLAETRERPRPSAPRETSVDQVTWREKLGLGLGKVVADGTHGTLHVLVNPIYNMTLGVNPALISTIVFVQRLWDAMLDPIWGNFSDNFRSRWGRRRPLAAAALVPLALAFAALWWFPRDASQPGLFWHLLLVSLVFYAAHSLYAMPVFGLTLEATDDYHERTRLAAFTLAFGFAFQIASQWVFPLTQLAVFSDGISGLRWVATGCALVFLACGLAPILLCRERHYARVATKQPPSSLLKNLRAAKGNSDFLALLLARLVVSFGYNVVGMLGLYMNMYYVFGGDLKAAAWAYGFLGSAFHVGAILASTLMYPRLAQRFGKKRTFQIAAGILILGCLAKLVAYQPGQPWLQFIVLTANGIASAGLLLIPASMLGDIVDADEIKTGLRREALFASLLCWFEKAGNSAGSLLAGFVLVAIGFDAKLGAQAPGTLQWMKFSYFLAPVLGACAALVLIHRYTLTEARAGEAKRILQLRRQVAAETAATAH